MNAMLGLVLFANYMLGPNSRSLSGPKHEGTKWECESQGEHTGIVNAHNNCSPGVPSMSTWGSIYRDYYMMSLQCL
jgi:hypothetical protein